MLFAKIKGGKFVDWVDLHADFPNVSWPAVVTEQDLPQGVVEVAVHAASAMPLQVIERPSVPALVNGAWVLTERVLDMNPSERQAKTDEVAFLVRADRDARLAACDWTQVIDAPVDKAVWATYRQALRDITSQRNFPFEVQWPTQPE